MPGPAICAQLVCDCPDHRASGRLAHAAEGDGVCTAASGQGDETNVLVFKLKAGCVRKQQPDGQWAVQGENGAPCSVNPGQRLG